VSSNMRARSAERDRCSVVASSEAVVGAGVTECAFTQ